MAKPIMIQGTMSNVGKSLLTTALCRIFVQDGYKVAPFKSQNMALNSYVTPDNLEIGTAQAVQAEACKILPDVIMNPILLKPTTNSGSQVIINGEVYGNMRAFDYFRNKKKFLPYVMDAYEKLNQNYDIIVIEGAGSPVEMNLKKDDIVNMGLAQTVKSPVLLVGDIDRGGVFAQLLGTLSLLEESELNLVKGLIVNKFRGDQRLFADGIKILEERGKKPVLGVVPFTDCQIDGEDSLCDTLHNTGNTLIDIAVIRLPKLANYTDFAVFQQYENVAVRYVERAEDLQNPDMIIIPGTKSTIADMQWLRTSHLEKAIKDCHARQIPIFGICGGYQILGRMISDPDHIENGGEITGMGLLDIDTMFSDQKKRTNTTGKIICTDGFFSTLNNAEFYGYEIHMGKTTVNEPSFAVKDNSAVDGAYHENVAGTYLHGIFDSQSVSERLVNALFRKKGIVQRVHATDRKTYKEIQYNLLADTVRKHLDMKQIYQIIKEGV
ncbi:MAG: cobyric acid synthase [Clostridia bacterium]|nr:cobyric acid synthase [Clostridia bacterium]